MDCACCSSILCSAFRFVLPLQYFCLTLAACVLRCVVCDYQGRRDVWLHCFTMRPWTQRKVGAFLNTHTSIDAHARTHTCIHKRMHTHAYTRIHTHTHTYTHASTHGHTTRLKTWSFRRVKLPIARSWTTNQKHSYFLNPCLVVFWGLHRFSSHKRVECAYLFLYI